VTEAADNSGLLSHSTGLFLDNPCFKNTQKWASVLNILWNVT